ncbi:MAG: cation-transporting P-type ATPase [bacterium]|nr:cation-transporting P-type ATPase [bacterium]
MEAKQQTLNDVLAALGTDGSGLTEGEVIRRRQRFGCNVLSERARPGALAHAVHELKNPILIVLAVAAIAAIAFGERVDGLFILATLVITAGFGMVMALRAERALDALRGFLHPKAIVVRGGHEVAVDTEELVPGDLLLLRRGMRIPADARTIEARSLEVDESMLTGESVPVQKTTLGGTGEHETLSQGTLVVEGQGVAVVTAIGAETTFASIAASLTEERERTPLQEQLAQFARVVAIVVTVAAVTLSAIGIARGLDAGEMLATAIAVAVAAVPEGLAVAITAILAVGTVRLARKQCLVRRIIAAETLGSVTIILTDKTGTLTEGRMRTVAVHLVDGGVGEVRVEPGMACVEACERMMVAAAIGTEVSIANPEAAPSDWEYLGSSTEAALVSAAGTAGVDVLRTRAATTILDRLPFSVERKYSATLIQRASTELIILGAPEYVTHAPLPQRILEELDVRAREGFRIVAAAGTPVSKKMTRIADLGDDLVDGAVLLGLFFIRDPLRQDAARAIAAAQQAGVRTIMVTGDHPATAKRIAEDAGLAAGEPVVMTGTELEGLSDTALHERIASVDIFARTSHAQKARLVAAWRARGEAVAVTGDGVNDAPALAAADIGIAMGSGTDVSREAADLVLLDNKYETIVEGIRGGRAMWDNIRKTANYLLISGFTELLLVGVSVFTGLPLLILPAQILWVNLLEDTLPAAALAFEPPESGIMDEPPRKRSASLFDPEMRAFVFGVGLVTDIFLIGAGFALYHITGDLDLTRTIVFGALAANSLFVIFAVRSRRRPIWRTRPWENPALLIAIAIAIALLLFGLLAPAVRPLLRTVHIPLWGWGIIIGLSVVNLVAVEAVKAVFRMRRSPV